MLIKVLILISSILCLIFIYKKLKQDEEKLLGLKLIGYCILGSFGFNINSRTLPIGFIIYIIFFRPKTNVRAKRYAAVLGLILFFTNILSPTVSESYFERTRHIDASSTNAYQIDYEQDYQSIAEKLNINNNSKLENFIVTFRKDGHIESLRYMIIERKPENLVLYNVHLDVAAKKYDIQPTKATQWTQYNRLTYAENFFKNINKLKFEKVIPQKDYLKYSISSSGEWKKEAFKGNKNYIIKEDKIEELSEEELSQEGYNILVYGYEKISANGYEGVDYRVYTYP